VTFDWTLLSKILPREHSSCNLASDEHFLRFLPSLLICSLNGSPTSLHFNGSREIQVQKPSLIANYAIIILLLAEKKKNSKCY
jgi:hypothetical protein